MESMTLEAMLAQMDTLAAQMEELTRTTVMWMVISTLLVVFLFAILLLVLRMSRRNRLMQAWLERELPALRQAGSATGQRARPAPKEAAAQAARPDKPPARQPGGSTRAPDLTALVNDMLGSNQPYNFVEALRALEPELPLQRLSPSEASDPYDRHPLLEPGGDGLFAQVQGSLGYLYPNYSRFSATLDPKPLFDGARHGGRIAAVIQPARLRRREDGTWLVLERGRVQMRQGG